jgi:hypothetical protein
LIADAAADIGSDWKFNRQIIEQVQHWAVFFFGAVIFAVIGFGKTFLFTDPGERRGVAGGGVADKVAVQLNPEAVAEAVADAAEAGIIVMKLVFEVETWCVARTDVGSLELRHHRGEQAGTSFEADIGPGDRLRLG